MDMVSMKMTPAERKDMTAGASPVDVPEGPSYPLGLCLNFDDDTIGKLGFAALPSAGQTMILIARVSVSEVAMSDLADGKKKRRMILQVTDMELGPDKTKRYPVKTFYPDGN